MDKLCKEEEEKKGCGKDTAVKAEQQVHTFKFRYKSEYTVTCDTSMTVYEALKTNSSFITFCEKNEKKDVVIQRKETPRAAVTKDFPSCLIIKDELLDISFIKLDDRSSAEKKSFAFHSLMSKPENFVTFNIKTKGGTSIRRLMKNTALQCEVDYVCVFALKGEKLKRALKRDRRFSNVIFQKQCALKEQGTQIITNMLNKVDYLEGKQFEVIVTGNQASSQQDSQESSQEFDTVKSESNEASADPLSSQKSPDPCQYSETAQQKSTQPPGKQIESKTYPNKIQVLVIPNTSEILKDLRAQFGGLLKTLKERENMKKAAEVQKLFREEYDKSVQSFSEVKRVKQLMELSNSVCQIRVEGYANGTGFLLFDRFILTNAHLIGNFDQFTQKMQHPVTAVFNFEDLDMGIKIPVNENLVAYYYGKDELGNQLDFALLEMSSDVEHPDCPELLMKYSPPSSRGGICIVGHPNGGVKRMDPCFIIPKEEVSVAVEKHMEENINFYHVITQQCLAEKWELNYSQIHYDTCFFHGSSGSPVFDEYCNLIGVHTGGFVYEGERGKTRSMVEYAYPMLPILKRIIIQCRERRPDIVHYFESLNNMKHVLNVANGHQ